VSVISFGDIKSGDIFPFKRAAANVAKAEKSHIQKTNATIEI
jgi:hypothetical protein